jgi:vacuolar-type H+-ATPase subunit H
MTTADATRAQASQVAGTATDEARDVMQQARAQAKSTARKMENDLRQRANEEASKFADTLRDASSQFESMAQCVGDDSLPANLVREGAQATRRLASHIDEGGIDRVMADVRSWARRNPGGFLLGAAFAGFVAGRVARNLSAAMNGDGSQRSQRYDAYGEDYGYAPGNALEYGEDAYPTTVGPTGAGGLTS